MSKNDKENKTEGIIKWVVAIIFAGLVGLFIWSPFAAQDRENDRVLQQLKESQQRNKP